MGLDESLTGNLDSCPWQPGFPESEWAICKFLGYNLSFAKGAGPAQSTSRLPSLVMPCPRHAGRLGGAQHGGISRRRADLRADTAALHAGHQAAGHGHQQDGLHRARLQRRELPRITKEVSTSIKKVSYNPAAVALVAIPRLSSALHPHRRPGSRAGRWRGRREKPPG